MIFQDSLELEPGTTRTRYHQLDIDVQIALEDLDFSLAEHNHQLIVKDIANNTLEIEIWIPNKKQKATAL